MIKTATYSVIFLLATIAITPCQAGDKFETPDLLKSYQEFKQNSKSNLIELMSAQDLELIKESTTDVPTSCQIDSVYFASTQQNKWALFKSVDLGYLKDVEITVAFETEDVSQSMQDIINTVSTKYPNVEVKKEKETGSYIIEYKAKDTWIVDDRWVKEAYSPLKTVFTYRLTDFGGMLVVEMNETIAKKTIKTIEVPAARFNQLAQN